MPKLTQLEELDIAIKMAAQDAEPGTTSAQIAEDFCRENAELIAPFLMTWAVQKVAILIGKHRRKRRTQGKTDHSNQLVFEEMLGFKHLPAKVEIAGEMVPRGKATITAYRALIAELERERRPVIEDLRKAVILMAPYSRKNRGITWAQVLKEEAKKREYFLRALASTERNRQSNPN